MSTSGATGPSRRRRWTDAALAARAAYALRGNDVGPMTTAAPALYPHMWSWDAAFIAVGLAQVSVPRAVAEMQTLLSAQWSNGMIPHIVFAPDVTGYFPDADRWGCSELAVHAPAAPRTSGICQPPVHAIALQRIVQAAEGGGAEDRATAHDFLQRSWDAWVRWHRWLASSRDPLHTGRVTIHHGWESGMDNSPRWDAPYARVRVGADLPPYRRRDVDVVQDATQRPSDAEYDRYLWLVEEMRRARYDDAAVRRTASFAAEDVFLSAVLALACDVLGVLGVDHGMPEDDVAEQFALAERFRSGVAASVDPATGLARDRDVRADEWLATETVAGFAPLLCGGLDRAAERDLLRLLDSPRWCGHPSLLAAVPPTTSPDSADYRPREYWRGPQWPVIAWLFGWAFGRRGWTDRAERLRVEALHLLADGSFAEYYEPTTGEPLGSAHQSWTAAAALDWLC